MPQPPKLHLVRLSPRFGGILLIAGIYLLCALTLLFPIYSGMGKAAETDETKQKSDSVPVFAESGQNSGTEPDSDAGEAGEETERTVSVYNATSGETETMTLEAYVVGAVCAEMPHTYPTEALKAQAVAIRSYCLYRLKHGEAHENSDARLCTDYHHCMAYLSAEEVKERWGEDAAEEVLSTVSAAVRATEGEYLTYDGEVIAALFFSSSCSMTEDACEVWGGDYPYLRSVSSPESPEISTLSVSSEELRELMEKEGGADFSSALYGDEPKCDCDSSGRVRTFSAFGYRVSGTSLRSLLSLASACFRVEKEEDGSFTFTVTGSGHGVGLSQEGARTLAEEGKTYIPILLHYYTGCEVGKGEATK